MLNGAQGSSSRVSDRRVAIQWAVCLLLVAAFLTVESTFPLSMNAQVLVPHNDSAAPAAVLQSAIPSSTPISTATRTPTQAVRVVSRSGASIPGQPQVDANTVALYHFDSPAGNQVLDATGQYTGTIQGNASIITEGLYSGALRVSPGGRVLTGYLGDLRQGSVEAFVDFAALCNTGGVSNPIVVAGPDPPNGNITMLFGSYNYTNGPYPTVSLSIKDNDGWQTVVAGINTCRYLTVKAADYWPYEAWRYHHVAGTWGPRGMEIWVDGVLHGLNSHPVYRQSCNPQEQIWGFYDPMIDYSQTKMEPWIDYPLCPKPKFSNGPVAGTYTGGLPTYSTFQIAGCAPGMACFASQIDEVRISNVQRIWDWRTTDPTSTPTVTLTPVRVGAYSVDPHTVVLSHMDTSSGSYLYDEVSRQWSWGANRSLQIAAGRYNNAVNLDGQTVISFINPSDPSAGTIEAWVNLAALTDPVVIVRDRRTGPGPWGLVLGSWLQLSPNVVFALHDGSKWIVADSGVDRSILVGAWHHIAGTWGPYGLQIWVDGRLRGSASYYLKPYWTPYVYAIGCDGWNCLNGAVDELRISSIQRVFAPVATPTPVFSALPASIATTTVQSASPGLSTDDEARLNGMINPVHRGLSQPGGSSPTGPLAALSMAATPAPAAAAPIAVSQSPVSGSSSQNISSASQRTNPLSMNQPLELDANAVALYRLNSQYGITLSDATGNYPAILFGDATIKSNGEERQALTLTGGLSYAQVSHFASPRTGTVEVWASFDANPGQMTIVAARQNNAPRFLLGVRADESLSLGFGLYNSGWQWADSGVTLRMLGSGWHHLAGTWGPRGVEIWIDGVLRAVNPYSNGLSDGGDNTLLIGWSPGSTGMNGQISQIRISNSQRSY